MRKKVAIIILTFVMSHTIKVQGKYILSMQVSFNQIEWGLQRTLLNEIFLAEPYAGDGNYAYSTSLKQSNMGYGFVDVNAEVKLSKTFISGPGQFFFICKTFPAVLLPKDPEYNSRNLSSYRLFRLE